MGAERAVSALNASLVIALVTFVLGGATTYLTTRQSLQMQFDASLRDLRLDAYRALWKELEPLAKYSAPAGHSTVPRIRTLSEALRRWYFEEGGLVLSVATRTDYFALQDGLLQVITSREAVQDGDRQPLTDAEFEFVRCSAAACGPA